MKNINYIPENFERAEFYPTPKGLAEKMLRTVDWNRVNCVLEPSAGKGDLVDEIKAAYGQKARESSSDLNIDCIEIDSNLQHILRGKGYRVIHDDFLSFNSYKQYSLIVMNPPFSSGEKHLLKAISLLKNGGQIVCLLNAETIKNPYSKTRQNLQKLLMEYSADIEYIQNAFVEAERKTAVEIALVSVHVPGEQRDDDYFLRNLKKAKERMEDDVDHRASEITFYDFIKNVEAEYNAEVETGIGLIEHYRAITPYIKDSMDPDDQYKSNILELNFYNDRNGYGVSINKYIERVRMKYWSYLFSNQKFMGHLTSELQTTYRSMVGKLKDYDFSEYNIKVIMLEMNAQLNKSIQDAIMTMFDKLTAEHAWYPECKKNTHYYNGWANNLAHKVNKKVILPCYDVFSPWNKAFRSYQAASFLRDIEKIFDFFDGNMTRHVDLSRVLSMAEDNPKNIECKYFKVSFYKKGTVHITFKDDDLLTRFNIYAAQNRNWLPPCYGRKSYNEMTEEEKSVIKEFQGEKQYEKVVQRPEFYLTEIQTFGNNCLITNNS